MANIDVMYSSKSNEWATPQDFFDKLNAEFQFNLDPCATDENHKCNKYFTRETDGLSQNWGGTAYSAILHTAEKSAHGWKSVITKLKKKIQSWLCSYRQGRIRSIFTIISTTAQKYALSEGG